MIVIVLKLVSLSHGLIYVFVRLARVDQVFVRLARVDKIPL